MAYPAGELECIRGLACRVAEIAAEPRMTAILARWRDVSALRKPDRAPVWCKPVGCWSEILPTSSLVCRDPGLRDIELELRKIVFKREVDDDTPVPPYIEAPAVFQVTPRNIYGLEINHTPSDSPGGAWAYDPPLKSEADFDRLVLPEYHYDAAATRANRDRMREILGGVLPVKVAVNVSWEGTLGTAAANLRGLETMMLDTLDHPDWLHRLMAVVRDAALRHLDCAEATGVLRTNAYDPMMGSGPVGAIPPGGRPTCANLWCMANSQEFDQVSPAAWQEFCLEYQKPILRRFGFTGYGCCENLTRKLDGVLTIPNLRIVTCGAWTNLDTVIEKTNRRYCIMWRQKASDVVFARREDEIRGPLEDGARRLRGCYYQIVLRELQTMAGHSDRLHVWTRLAKEAAEKYAS
ncbi:MAG: hypothetical protein V1809_09735 [Planctomycetota bacterium]